MASNDAAVTLYRIDWIRPDESNFFEYAAGLWEVRNRMNGGLRAGWTLISVNRDDK